MEIPPSFGGEFGADFCLYAFVLAVGLSRLGCIDFLDGRETGQMAEDKLKQEQKQKQQQTTANKSQ